MPATLQYVPRDEMRRIATLPAPAPARAVAFAVACRINALYMIARAGSGHPGTSFSCLDVLAWLFLEELRRTEDGGARDCYFSSKGHDAPALYAVLAGLGHLDFELIHALRRLGGLPGHPDVATPGCVTNTGSLGMGISKAKGMIIANRLRGVDARVFVLTGDGTANCEVTSGSWSCFEEFVGVTVDLEAVAEETQGLPAAEAAGRLEVSQAFGADPIGILDFDP